MANSTGVTVMVGLASTKKQGVGTEKDIGNGILAGHEYTLIQFIDRTQHGIPLLMVCRNPWGKGEYQGVWSDRDKGRWTKEVQQITGYTPDPEGEDGIFCMPFSEAFKSFNQWDLSFLYPEWFYRQSIRGEWNSSNAGGCGNNGQQNFLKNPQYLLDVPKPQPGMRVFGQVVVTQEDHRWINDGSEMLYIGFNIFRSDGKGRIKQPWRAGVKTKYTSGSYSNKRTASCMCDDLPPGKYVIIPTTFDPGECGKFTVSVWMSFPVQLKYLG